MIEAINFRNIPEFEYVNQDGTKLDFLYGLNRINLFIGENNSGKSRLLRYMYRDLVTILGKYQYEKNGHAINDYFRSINILLNRLEREMICPKYEIDINHIEEICKCYSYSFNLDTNQLSSESKRNLEILKSNINGLFDYLYKMESNGRKIIFRDDKPIYIPVLRGIEEYDNYFSTKSSPILENMSMTLEQRNELQKYKSNSKKIYTNKTCKAYGLGEEYVFTGENLYDDFVGNLLAGESSRKFVHNFQKFISENIYEGKTFEIIPHQKDEYLYVKIDNSVERPLYNLGDGVKQLITLLYKIYQYKNQEKVFVIEEPEINLHPGLQRKFLQLLQLSEFNKHQYFISTHSNHLIDSVFDYEGISIYKFINIGDSNNKFKVVKSDKNDVELLDILGVNNSSVFMANCTIWVEGLSDKIYISKYLEILMKDRGIEYLEGINYSFVEYGGNLIEHWEFEPSEDDKDKIKASGITNRCFYVCDNDGNKKQERKERMKLVFKENYLELNVREMENTIKQDVLEKTLFEDEEVKIKDDATENYYNKTGWVGDYIDQHYDLTKKYSARKSDGKGTGTIKNKIEFSKDIVKNINSLEDMTDEAKRVADEILNFIIRSNNG